MRANGRRALGLPDYRTISEVPTMSDFHLVDPQGWVYDLQSVYSAYIGYFQLHDVPWHDRTWGQFFETFEQFLGFSWPVVTVTDTRTGRAHVVTRMTSINAFLKMIKMRFGETLPQVDNMLLVKPIEVSQRHLRHVNDWSTYKKLHASLPAVALASFKARVRGGDPSAIRELWATRSKTFFTMDFESLERNDRSCVEWGYAAIRSSYLEAAGAWPPIPDTNYRKGHYVVSEYADVFNKASSGLSRQYAFGESQAIPKTKLPRIIQSILSGLVSPDSETVANNVVLVGHGIQAIMQRLEDMKIKLPNNILMLDIAYLERALFTTGERGPMVDRKTGRARVPEAMLSLSALLHSFGIEPPCMLHNAGNYAFMTLVVFQRMMDLRGAVVVPRGVRMGAVNGIGPKGELPSGHGHVWRAATVAARIFRPLGGTQPDPGTRESGENGRAGPAQTRVGRHGGNGVGVDEVGVNVSTKRASVFSTLTSPLVVPADKGLRKMASIAGSTGSGKRLSVSTILPGQRRQSVAFEKRRYEDGGKG